MYVHDLPQSAVPKKVAAIQESGLETLRFDNRFTRELPADPDPRNRRRQ